MPAVSPSEFISVESKIGTSAYYVVVVVVHGSGHGLE